MLVLFLLLSILEDVGYMARVAFIMDRIFRKFPLDEGPAPLPGGPQHVAGGGDMVLGQLHNKGGGVPGKEEVVSTLNVLYPGDTTALGQLHNKGGGVPGESLGLLQDNAGDDDGRHTDEVGRGRHQRGAWTPKPMPRL